MVRDIASAAHAGTPFHRMAVLYWQREPYASLIAEQFAMAVVPTAGPTAGRLASTPVGRMVKGMVDLAAGDLPTGRSDALAHLLPGRGPRRRIFGPRAGTRYHATRASSEGWSSGATGLRAMRGDRSGRPRNKMKTYSKQVD